MVDLCRIEPRILDKYMGHEGTSRFRCMHAPDMSHAGARLTAAGGGAAALDDRHSLV